MPIEPRVTLETYFETGDIPTAEQFKSLILSYAHLLDDDITVSPIAGTTQKNWGFGITAPQTRVGVKAGVGEFESVLSLYHHNSDFANWFVSLNPTTQDRPGFSIDQVIAGGQLSQFFIEEGSGNVGIGTTQPNQKLNIVQSVSSGVAGIGFLNTANTVNDGWIVGEEQNSTQSLDGAFSFYVNSVSPDNKHFTILSNGNCGIGESAPDVKLNISRPISDPNSDLDLRTGTGVMVVGEPTANVVMDRHGMQARSGDYTDPTNPDTLNLVADTLNIQPLSGDVLFHGDFSIPVDQQAILTSNGSLGLGTVTPAERLDVNGAVRLGNTATTNIGTIRFNTVTHDFEGYNGTAWKSLTAGNGPWTHGTDKIIYYLDGTTSRVGIGISDAAATLDINDAESVTTGNVAARVHNQSGTNSSVTDSHRIGLQVFNDGTWGGLDLTKNIAIHVPHVTGHTPAEANIAAALAGNVLIGALVSGQQMFGGGAVNVLSIQAGVAPASSPDLNAVQLYSGLQAGTKTASFFMRLGNGDILSFFKGPALPVADNSPVTDTYTSVEANVLINLRNRMNALEKQLQNNGLIG